MSEFDDGTPVETPPIDAEHPDQEESEVVDVDEDLEPDDVQEEEELEGVDDLDFDSVDVENVPVLEEGADD